MIYGKTDGMVLVSFITTMETDTKVSLWMVWHMEKEYFIAKLYHNWHVLVVSGNKELLKKKLYNDLFYTLLLLMIKMIYK